jgi:hypothetical protein
MIHLAPTGAWLESTPSGLDFLTEPERRPGLLFKHPPVRRWSSTQRRARSVRWTLVSWGKDDALIPV